MIFYLGKILSLLFAPAGIVLMLLIAALVFYRRGWLCRTAISVAIVLLWGLSTQIVAQALMRGLETRVPGYSLESAPQEPVIVVLGGFMTPPSRGRPEGDFRDSMDRLLHGFRLYRGGKAPLILVTGGTVPMFGEGLMTESEAARAVLKEWGVPESAILVETKSQNTAENGAFTRDMLAQRGIKRVLLVTSAAHMPRAVAAFKKAGLEVTPSPSDFQTGYAEPDLPFRFLPDAEALHNSTDALREYIGLFVYRLRGWA